MLPSGNGMVDFGPGGTFRDSSFLVRTLPLRAGLCSRRALLAQGMSLMGYRHAPAYAGAIGQAVDFVRGRENPPVWLVGASREPPPRSPPQPGSAARSPASS